MNNRGQAVIFLAMFATVIIIIALAFAPAINQSTENARANSSGDTIGLNCSSPSDDFVRATCVSTDLLTPYFFVFLIGLAGMIITARVVFG